MVAMNVWPTDAADGSVASEARWRKMGRQWANSGVCAGTGTDLPMKPTLSGTNLTVTAGACWVDGHYCELAGDQVLTVTANGLVVVRFDPAANTAELLYRDAATAPSQSPAGIWELEIAQIIGSVLQDRRIGAPAAFVQGIPNYASWTSNYIEQTPIVGRRIPFDAIANHMYRFDFFDTVYSNAAPEPSVTIQLSVDFGGGFQFLNGTDVMKMTGSLPYTADISGIARAPWTIRNCQANVQAVKTWYSGSGTCYWTTGQVNPLSLYVTDLGPAIAQGRLTPA